MSLFSIVNYRFGDEDRYTVRIKAILAKGDVNDKVNHLMENWDDIHTDLGQQHNQDHDGDLTGQVLWEAADAVCRFVKQNISRFSDRSICELGAGAGLTSIMIVKTVPNVCVVSTDGNDLSLALLKQNAALNFDGFTSNLFRSYSLNPQGGDFVSTLLCEKLCWDVDVSSFSDRLISQSLSPVFDWIIAADVIYDTDCITPLFATALKLMNDKDESRFLLAFVPRGSHREGIDYHALVYSAAKACGFVEDHSHWTVPVSYRDQLQFMVYKRSVTPRRVTIDAISGKIKSKEKKKKKDKDEKDDRTQRKKNKKEHKSESKSKSKKEDKKHIRKK